MLLNRSSIWGYIKNYKWRSVFFKYFGLIVLVIIIPFTLFNVLVFQYYNSLLEKEIATSNIQTLLKTRSTVDMITNEINKIYAIINSNEYVKSFISTDGNALSGYDSYTRSREIADIQQNFINTSDFIETMYIYSTNNNYVFSFQNSAYLNDFYDKSWYEEYKKNGNGNFTFTHTVSNGVYQYPSLTISREMYIYDNCDGLLIINIDLRKLEKLLNRSHPSKNENLYIVDSNGIILYSNDNDAINKNVSYKTELEDAFKSSGGENFTGKRYKDNVVSSLQSESNDWHFISLVSISSFMQKIQNVRNIIISGLILAIAASLLLALFISLHLYKSVIKIIALLQNPDMREDAASKHKKNSSFNEILYICKNIINIIDSNKRIEDELAQRLALLRKTQSIALQTQINPHFLFNTLQLVNLIIMRTINGDNEATKIISLLSDLLRITLNTKEHLVPLALEVEHAQKYLQIQSIKFNNKFDVEWNISPYALEKKTIKLVLQPLIENSINHGIKPIKRKCKIVVSAAVENKLLTITVSDNGAGITPSRLEEIRLSMSDENIRENENIGLSNVNQRIKLMFGERYGVEIASENGEGTSVRLTMPEIE